MKARKIKIKYKKTNKIEELARKLKIICDFCCYTGLFYFINVKEMTITLQKESFLFN